VAHFGRAEVGVIRVERAEEPPDFEAKVRAPGREWLAKHDRGDPPDHWRHARHHLRNAFRSRCGYTAMFLQSGTVDHFVSRSEDKERKLVYEWRNLRYAAGWINSSKSGLPSSEVLDPFDVGDDWFAIELPRCELVMTEHCPLEYQARALTMLERLHLGLGEEAVSVRREFYDLYLEGKLPLDLLEDWAPLIARAVRKQAAQETLPAPAG
jgi:hypothetical protein